MTRSTAPENRVPTLRRLLALDRLPACEVIGGTAGLAKVVSMVAAGSNVARLTEGPAGGLIVFARDRLALEEPQGELAIRFAVTGGLAGIVAERPPAGTPLSTMRLADKLGVPLIVFDQVDTAELIDLWDGFVRAPELAGASALHHLVRRIQESQNDADQLFVALAEAIDVPVALVDANGRVLSGNADALSRDVTAEFGALLVPERSTSTVIPQADGDRLVLQVALMSWRGPSQLWFIARISGESLALLSTVEQALGIASLAFSARFSRDALDAERDSRERALLLAEILDTEGSLPRSTIEHATALGWRITGWHVGIHVAIADTFFGEDAAILAHIVERLRPEGGSAGFLEKPDGWVAWTTFDYEPHPMENIGLISTIKHALIELQGLHPHARVNAGIGRAYHGAAGIGRSLAEARNACQLAQTSAAPTAVEHADALNVSRLMTGWYHSDLVRETAREVLAPLHQEDPSGELVRTLRCYLDNESSTITTSIMLAVHRNTVAQRLAKIKGLLPLSLDRPDDRLVLHLATRGIGVEWDDRAEPDA